MGITRDAVIQLARDLGYQVSIAALTLEDLETADEAFFTGTAAEVTPIREIDGVLISGGKCGPITKRIQDAFFAAVAGREQKYRNWLHYVEVEALAPAIDGL